MSKPKCRTDLTMSYLYKMYVIYYNMSHVTIVYFQVVSKTESDKGFQQMIIQSCTKRAVKST